MPERARYEIFDTDGSQVAVVQETEKRSRIGAFANVVPTHRAFDVTTSRHEPLLTMIMNDEWHADLISPGGEPIGRIRVGFSRREYTLLDDEETVVAKAAGDLPATKFAVTGPAGERYAEFRKTWAGLRKEIFTEADNYTIRFGPGVPARTRTIIVMVPVVLDMSLHGPY